MEYALGFWNIISHLDVHLTQWSHTLGPWVYALLFAIVFCETGLVVTPFLPGDSLLFTTGALCVPGSALNAWVAIPLLVSAAVLGDAVNYAIGYRVGPKVFTSETSRLLNRKHLLRTQLFYEKYGGKTIIFARFMPVVRTFAPFVAGIGQMRYLRFFSFNVIGALAWVLLFVPAGLRFGNLPSVRSRFHLVILAIIVISVLPALVEFVRARRARARALPQA